MIAPIDNRNCAAARGMAYWTTVRILRSTAIAVLLGVALAAPDMADAGEYTVHTCKAPGGAKAATPWTIEQRYPSGYFTGNACPGGYLWTDLVPTVEHPGDDFVRVNFLAPAGTEISAYSLRRSVQLTSPYHYDFHEIRADGGVEIRETCFGDAGCTDLGDWRAGDAAGNLLSASGRSGVTGISFSMYCRNATPGSPSCPRAAPANNFQLHRGEVTLTDATPPAFLLPPSGPLVDAEAPLAGRQPVWIWAADRGGGVRDVLFEVDGQVVDRATLDDNDGRCREPYDAAQPCKLEARGSVSLDTTRLADGEHQLRLLATDATGTNAATWGPMKIETANGACDPEPRSDALKLSATFAAKPRARVRSVRYAQGAAVRGRVTRPDGTPAAGVSVCVADRVDAPDAGLRPVGTVTTDAGGNFGYRLGRGPSRRVYFVTRLGGGAVSSSLRLDVKAAPQLRASRRELVNGQVLTFDGSLVGGPVPRRGVLVELQVRRPKGWQTFATTRTTRRGQYRHRYRFTRTAGVLRYRFRARVPTQDTYPYTTGASRPLTVTVRG